MSCLGGDSSSIFLQQGSGAKLISGCNPIPGDIPKNICPATCLLPLVPTAHTPDNSFMGFVSEELNQTEKQLIKANKVSSMAVVYGKEASIWKVGVLGLLGSSQAGRGRHRQGGRQPQPLDLTLSCGGAHLGVFVENQPCPGPGGGMGHIQSLQETGRGWWDTIPCSLLWVVLPPSRL